MPAMRAGFCYNLKRASPASDHEEEYDEIETVDFIDGELRAFGFEVVRMEQDETLFTRLLTERPDFVFNIAEGKGRSRSRESQVPCLLDWLGIPYYGSDATALGIALDKWLTSTILKGANVRVPETRIVFGKGGSGLDGIRGDGRRFIVKPRWEGSSKGVFENSVVNNPGDAMDRAHRIIKDYSQPALVEEFIDGEEVTVGLVGNGEPEIIGMMRISEKNGEDPFVYSLSHKRAWREKIKYERADKVLSEAVVERLHKCAVAAFRALELRDAARIDFRINDSGEPFVIDVNPLPGLSPVYSDLMLMSQLHGREFSDVLRRIIRTSLARNGIRTG